ncbi:phage tail protein [Escherichia coli]|uniref:phage tail protein n=1 Tax=Escherichia coli TaxID=562 RepID=UPI0028EB4540|nr:phage tail protein [Escherichia coli]WNU64660.1 phage tail protein [Escherichia coli]
MSKIVRYQGDVRAFASDAQGMERTVFGGTNQADDLTSQITASFLRGWGIVGASEHPSLEDFNAAMYAMSQFIAYQHQMGVPEWHAEQEYHIGSICTHNGESYQSLQNANIGSQPPSAKWTPVLTSKNGLANLGLGEGSALPVGVPVPWPSATPPTGWLKCNGAPFSAEEYPKLAKAYPKLKLPDLRGEFIRGWDDGRGVDSARLLLSSQAASILEHSHEMHGWTGNPLMASDVYSSGSSVFAVQLSIGDGGLLYSWKDGSGTTNDSKRMDRTNHVSSGAGDGSPRNIAFNYIVRAA